MFLLLLSWLPALVLLSWSSSPRPTQYYSVLRTTTLYYTILFCLVDSYSVLHSATWYYTVLLCTTILLCATLFCSCKRWISPGANISRKNEGPRSIRFLIKNQIKNNICSIAQRVLVYRAPSPIIKVTRLLNRFFPGASGSASASQ